ncbi:hypothetical protein [Glutamicibacter creatinolyticus]|uniref:hypothetical protein n=1 Tax=Glutamicibacter creatinolyticus TaxID=162496 RepID=UPI0031D2574B
MQAQELLSLSDIARLANVQRPVVTVWRSRSKGTVTPFPDPVHRVGSQDLFDAADVVAWLQVTGRGNNPEFREDSAAFSSAARDNFHAITSLLLLHQLLGRPLSGLSPEDLLDAADEVDPDDEFIYSELEEESNELKSLGPYVDRLIDAAYSAQSAFESLLTERFRANEVRLSRTSVSAEALRLAALCALELSGSDLVFHEATAGGSDLISELLSCLDESASARIQEPAAGSQTDSLDRLTLRRLKMLGSTNESLTIFKPQGGSLPTVHLAQFPSPGMPDDDPESILQAIDDLVLELGPAQGAVLVAPANVLVDALESKTATGIRAQILRMGRVRAAVRLPQGHFLYKPRTALCLWVIGPEIADVPLADRRIMLANLSDMELDDHVVPDFIADLGASLLGEQALRAHAFRFAHWARTSALAASTTDLIPARSKADPRPLPDSVTLAKIQVEYDMALANLNCTAGPRPELSIELRARAGHNEPSPRYAGTATLGELLAQKIVRLIPGTRFAKESLTASPEDGLKVWNTADLYHGSPSATVSYFDLARTYGQAALTVPGDIVFSAKGAPAAVVDHEGSKAVNYPVRILRVNADTASGIIPEVLSMDINSAHHSAWRRWEVRRLPTDLCRSLEESLRIIAEERTAATQRLVRLDDMSQQLINALSSGELEILVPDTGKEGRP